MENTIHQFLTGSGLYDLENWDKFREKDRSGLEGIFRKYISQLFSFGMSVVPNDDLSKDCMQDVFFVLSKNKNSVKNQV